MDESAIFGTRGEGSLNVTRKNDVLLTGATGLIGGEIAALLSGTGYRVWALVRAKNQIDAAHRIAARFARSSYSVPSTLIPVCGDITQGSN